MGAAPGDEVAGEVVPTPTSTRDQEMPSRDEAVFTRGEYARMIELALASGYEFRPFERRNDPGSRVCLMRHDVDIDVGAASQMAALEAELGIRATYFLMLRSPVYNLFSRSNQRFVQEILSFGHSLGLHYDQGFEPDERSLPDLVAFEANILESAFRTEVHAVSFHQPGPAVLENEVDVSPLINTYDARDMDGFAYVSDSNMTWREQSASRLFESARHPRLHLLIHPLWWVADEPGMTTAAAFERALLANWARAQEQMLATERAYGSPRRFTITSE
jgi:hypothetical protein